MMAGSISTHKHSGDQPRERLASAAILQHSTKETTMTTETKPQPSTGNRLKFKLEFMIMMLNAGRDAEASNIYEQLIEEFDKLA